MHLQFRVSEDGSRASCRLKWEWRDNIFSRHLSGHSCLTIVYQKGGFCPSCGFLTNSKNGWHHRKIITMEGERLVLVERVRCWFYKRALPIPPLEEVDRNRWYGKDLVAYASDRRMKDGLSTRDTSDRVMERSHGITSPSNVTIWHWTMENGNRSSMIMSRQLLPYLNPWSTNVLHGDELYQNCDDEVTSYDHTDTKLRLHLNTNGGECRWSDCG